MEATVSAPLQGLGMETGWVSLTQAAGLHSVRSPLWGWEVRTSISKSLRQIRTSPTVLLSRQSTTSCGRLPATMAKQPSGDRIELVYGSLDMLILRTLRWGPTHGHGIAKSIERLSEETLKVEHGSLYPALQRLQQEGWITAQWGVSKNKQRAKYYRLTAAGRRQLVAETSRWERFVRAITGILWPAESEEGQ